MIFRLYPSLLLVFYFANAANAEGIKPFAKFDTFLLSEPVAIDAIGDNWNAKYHTGGENQIASAWIESGVKKGRWSFSALFREEQQLVFDSETADLYYTVVNDNDLIPNKDYRLDLDAYRFRGYGGRIARAFRPKHNLHFEVGTSLFYASKLLEGNLSGTAGASDEDDYTFQFESDYSYDEDVLLGRKGVDSPRGIGVSLDLSATWYATKQLSLTANAKDLAGAIYWKDAPFTEAVASSDTVTIDDDGFSSVNPAISGFEGYKSSYTQQLRPSVDLTMDYSLNNSPYSVILKSKHYKNLNLFSVGGSKDIGERTLAIHYWPTIETLEFNYKAKNFGLSFGLDDLNFSETRALWLNLKYQ